MKKIIKYSIPFILGIFISNYIYNGKESYVMSWQLVFASVIGGLLAGFIFSKINDKANQNE